MRILLLNQSFHPDITATAQHLVDIALHLREDGHEVVVIADRRAYEDRGLIYPIHEIWNGLEVRRVRTTSHGKRHFSGRIIDGISFIGGTIWRLLGCPRPDIVVSFTSPPLLGLLGVLYARIVGARSIHWLMDLNIDAAIALGRFKENSSVARILLRAFRYSLYLSSAVIVEDRFTAARAILRGARPETISIIPPWPAHEYSPTDEDSAAAFRAEYGIGNEFVVMFSGSHVTVHPLDTLLAAARQLDGQGFLFMFIGGGKRVRDVTEAVRQHKLKDIRQLPLQPRERISGSLTAAGLHVVVMGNEMNGLGHPSKMYGVLATGKPYVFIGPRESFAGDILAECPCGFAVEHGDVEGLVTAIRRARKLTPDEREMYRQANTAYLARRFGKARSLATFDRVIHASRIDPASSTASQTVSISSGRSERDDGR
jgi:colanic acid biosynthesis glycosyl transferase WcaI